MSHYTSGARSRIACIFAVLVSALGLLVISGWVTQTPELLQFNTNLQPIHYTTAVGFFLSGCATLAALYQLRQPAILAAALCGLLALLALNPFWSGNSLFDTIPSTLDTLSTIPSMVSGSALSFLALSLGIIVFVVQPKGYYWLATGLAMVPLCWNLIAISGISIGSATFSEWAVYTRSPQLVSIGFVLQSAALVLLNHPEDNTNSEQRSWLLGMIVSTIFSLLLFVVIELRANQRRTHTAWAQNDADFSAEEITFQLHNTADTLRRMANRWVANKGTPEALWREDAKDYYADMKIFRALEWVDPSMVVQWIEPMAGNEQAQQLNLGFEQTRRYALLAAKSKNTTDGYYSPLIDLIQSDSAVFLLNPLITDGFFDGWLLALLDLDKLMMPYSEKLAEKGYFTRLTQDNGDILFQSPGYNNDQRVFSVDITLPGQTWTLSLQHSPFFYEIHQTPLIAAIYVLMALLVFFLGWLIRQYIQQQQQDQLVQTLDQRQSSALDTMIDGPLVINENRSIQEVNKDARTMLGYTRDELLGRNINCMMPDPYHSEHDQYIHNYHLTGEKKIIGRQRELQAKRKDGSIFPITLAVTEGISSNAHFYTGVIQDLSEKAAYEKKLEEKDALFNAAVHASTAGFAITDLNGHFMEANDSLCRWLGHTNEEMLALQIPDVIAENEHPHIDAAIEQLAADDIYAYKEELCFQRKGGTQLWGLQTCSSVRDIKGKPQLLVFNIIDINQEKQLSTELEQRNKALEESNADLDRFAYVASHDLKSPLNAIQKLVNWIEEDCEDILPDSSVEHLDLLKSRAQRMIQLLDDLLMYSRIGRHYNYKSETINLRTSTNDIFSLLGKDDKFSLEAEDKELTIHRIPFELVLRNLISNSIKHHDKDTGTILINLSSTEKSYTIRVSDDGPGIPPNFHKKAMEMFQTLKPRDHVEGSGMGLAVVKKIIEYYNGTIHIESDGEHGCTFVIEWPKQEED